jgi:hypothetical protein
MPYTRLIVSSLDLSAVDELLPHIEQLMLSSVKSYQG